MMPDAVDEPVELLSFQETWAGLYQDEATRLHEALHSLAPKIEHIGSTAVQGLLAKPIIDIMVGLAQFPSQEADDALNHAKYEALGEAGVPGRHYHRKRHPKAFNVHVTLVGGKVWSSNLLLRSYLRSSPEAAARYTEAKRDALALGHRTLLSYSHFKRPIIEALLAEAERLKTLSGMNGTPTDL